jgi:hypothetical protein
VAVRLASCDATLSSRSCTGEGSVRMGGGVLGVMQGVCVGHVDVWGIKR